MVTIRTIVLFFVFLAPNAEAATAYIRAHCVADNGIRFLASFDYTCENQFTMFEQGSEKTKVVLDIKSSCENQNSKFTAVESLEDNIFMISTSPQDEGSFSDQLSLVSSEKKFQFIRHPYDNQDIDLYKFEGRVIWSRWRENKKSVQSYKVKCEATTFMDI